MITGEDGEDTSPYGCRCALRGKTHVLTEILALNFLEKRWDIANAKDSALGSALVMRYLGQTESAFKQSLDAWEKNNRRKANTLACLPGTHPTCYITRRRASKSQCNKSKLLRSPREINRDKIGDEKTCLFRYDE